MSVAPCVREAELEAARDGRLSPDDARDARRHATTCPRCARFLAETERVAALGRALPAWAPDAVTARRLRAKLVGAALSPPERAPSGPWGLRLGVALALFALGFALLGRGRGSEHATAVAPTAPAGGAGVDLQGAGTLWPAPDARVLVRRAGADTRIELSDGRIELQVRRRRAGERFVVHLSDAEVEVRGTRFTVEARRGALARVTVTEGVVAVRRVGDPERLLAAGGQWLLPDPPAPTAAPPMPAPTLATAPSPPASPAPPAPRAAAPGDATARWFREGAQAHARGEHGLAVTTLGRFLALAPARDPRREDASYLRVLSLRSLGRAREVSLEGQRYLGAFPHGLRRAEVAEALVAARVFQGDCEGAARASQAVPTDATASLRRRVSDALARCP